MTLEEGTPVEAALDEPPGREVPPDMGPEEASSCEPLVPPTRLDDDGLPEEELPPSALP
jgi:hypothetical protein